MSKYMSASCLMFLPRADKETVITINNRVLSSLENCSLKSSDIFKSFSNQRDSNEYHSLSRFNFRSKVRSQKLV